MSNLKQNNLAEATTELGFVQALNTNKGETVVALQKEVTLEDGTQVIVEGITPSKMKSALNSMVDGTESTITYQTPGEEYVGKDGVVQMYNDSVVAPDVVSIAITTPPTKTKYIEGETFDTTGMVVTATYSNGTTAVVTDYTITPSGALSTTDTSVTITYGGKTATQAITVSADLTITSDVTTSMNFYSFTRALKNSLSNELLNQYIAYQASESVPFLTITGKDEFSKIEFLRLEEGDNISMRLYFKTAGDTGSSAEVYTLNEAPGDYDYTVSGTLDAMVNGLAQESRYYELSTSEMSTGVAEFLGNNTPITISLDPESSDPSTYSTTVDIKDYLSIA